MWILLLQMPKVPNPIYINIQETWLAETIPIIDIVVLMIQKNHLHRTYPLMTSCLSQYLCKRLSVTWKLEIYIICLHTPPKQMITPHLSPLQKYEFLLQYCYSCKFSHFFTETAKPFFLES